MKIMVRASEEDYFYKLLTLLNNIPPFSKSRPKELELYGHLLRYYHNYRKAEFEDINHVIFGNTATARKIKIDISRRMGIPMSSYYTLLMGLRKHGIIRKKGFNIKYVLPKVKTLTFVFKTDEEAIA